MKATRSKFVGVLLGFLCVTLGVLTVAGCGQRETRLTNSSASPEDVCQKILGALERQDTLGLLQLRLTKFEHDSLLVPQMPLPPPGVERDMGMAWYMLEQRSMKGIRRALDDYGGQRFSLVKVRFTKPAEKLGYLVAHKGTEVTVRDSTGAEFTLPIFGSILEDNGRFKLVSIRD
jgi:hypothetical protein